MALTDSLTVVDIALALLAAWLLKRLWSRKTQLPLPPGPKGLPLIGNLLDMPSTEEWKTLAQWTHEYGDLTYLHMVNQSILFINAPSVAYELLDKRSRIYSDRPYLPMASGLVGWNNSVIFAPYDSNAFREQRKLLQSHIGSKARVKNFWEIQETMTSRFIKRLLDTPEDFLRHIGWTAGAIILEVTYGYEALEVNDPLIRTAVECIDGLSVVTTPGAFLVDALPFLRFLPAWFPGAGFKKTALKMRETLHRMADAPMDIVQKRLNSGTAVASFATNILNDQQLTDDDENHLKWAAASVYAGGSDSSVSLVQGFFLAMTHFPAVQALAQAELDAVVGPDRLPSLADRDRLPYLEALTNEVLRWSVVGPRGGAHQLSEDDTYRGYLIPKGTIVFPNVWWFLHDPEIYPDPMEFKPERFLGSNPAADPRPFVFGFGRRICPGMQFVDSSVFILFAMTLAVFNISKAVDPVTEEVIEPLLEFTSGTVSHPKPFKCSIKPRSTKAEELIQLLN
ncbi:hypothetical protein JAAARDRAFT_116817 [Jaapia argillacea MUCL 33604]|uniref:Cytochrome P450 n=1 Tax=Jaapia argillacea MUCL 33604 TaxID=933084 RepID=A0A067QD41_9AGAM|nr:hypothetical protein JAAARDRAFT_116817 [Jaapia argillacea MUCL 33604]